MDDKILKAIEGLSLKFDSLSKKVDNQGDLLKENTQILNNHGEQLKENTQILKALEHLAQVNKAERDKTSFDIAEISGEIKAMRKSVSNVELITASNWSDIVKLKAVK